VTESHNGSACVAVKEDRLCADGDRLRRMDADEGTIDGDRSTRDETTRRVVVEGRSNRLRAEGLNEGIGCMPMSMMDMMERSERGFIRIKNEVNERVRTDPAVQGSSQ